ncbi:MAG: transglycosylase SLT domain-containing protein [Myxococcota bacterium]
MRGGRDGLGRSVRGIAAAWGAMLLASLATAGPLDPSRVSGDAAPRLSATEKAAARALGTAQRAIESGNLSEARTALSELSGVKTLSGYAEWLRIRLLLEEGKPKEAYSAATKAAEAEKGAALRAALGVLQGEALAESGDTSAAELAWGGVLKSPAAKDSAVRQSIELSIVAARQRRGSLDPTLDPRVLLDETFAETTVAALNPDTTPLTPKQALRAAKKAMAKRHTARAIKLFDEALAGKLGAQDEKAARLGRAHAYFKNRDYPDAEKAFRALKPDAEARFWHARSLARVDRIADSMKAFEALGASTKKADAKWASWALYLVGTLYEGRDDLPRAIAAYKKAATFKQFSDRARSALWRQGWAEFRSEEYAEARKTLGKYAKGTEDPVSQLRPRYWGARAAMKSGDRKSGEATLAAIARDYPLTYYGWRAQERLSPGKTRIVGEPRKLAVGTRRVDEKATRRAALLIEAGLDDLARDELRHAATTARGLSDRVRVGALMTEVGDYHRANALVLDGYSDSLSRGLQEGQEALWWLSWPPAYREVIEANFPKNAKIDPELVWAIMREESHYQVEARSSVGALGLLQLMPETAAQLAKERGMRNFKEEQLFDPELNITLGAAYLAQLGARFPGRPSAAIGSYNAGPHKVATWLRGEDAKLEDDVWVESIPYDQTRAYVKRVLRSLHAYKSFYR